MRGNACMPQFEVNKSNYFTDTLLLRIYSCTLKIYIAHVALGMQVGTQ